MSHAHTLSSQRCHKLNVRQFRPSARPRRPARVLALSVGVREASEAAPRKWELSPPHVYIRTNKADIDPVELVSLYRTAATSMLAMGSRQRQRCYEHWTNFSDEELQAQLREVLDCSVVVAAAFTGDPRFCEGGAGWLPQGGAAATHKRPSTTARQGPQPHPDWLLGAWRPRQQRLVGFVRASGDRSLVATLHDLAVHPELQGCGVGKRLLRSMVQQVSDLGIYDVGLITPSELQPFFRGASFDLDHEDSQPMALGDARRRELLADAAGDEITGRVSRNASLARVLRRALL